MAPAIIMIPLERRRRRSCRRRRCQRAPLPVPAKGTRTRIDDCGAGTERRHAPYRRQRRDDGAAERRTPRRRTPSRPASGARTRRCWSGWRQWSPMPSPQSPHGGLHDGREGRAPPPTQRPAAEMKAPTAWPREGVESITVVRCTRLRPYTGKSLKIRSSINCLDLS